MATKTYETANTNSRLNDGSAINPSNYELLDSETNESLGQDDLNCSAETYVEAIRESLRSDQDEGHTRVNGRRVYAQHV